MKTFDSLFNELFDIMFDEPMFYTAKKQLGDGKEKNVKTLTKNEVESLMHPYAINTPQYKEDWDGEKYKLTFIAPGFDEKTLKTTFNTKTNAITFKSKREEKEENRYMCSSINTTLTIPAEVDPKSLAKKFENGVIVITGTAKEEEKTFEIEL